MCLSIYKENAYLKYNIMNEQSMPLISGQKTITIVHQGLNAKRLREASHISQEYIGKVLGISQQAVSILEEKLTLEDQIIDIYKRELCCQKQHITDMKTEIPADNTIHLKIEHNDNITFNPLDKLIEFSKDKDELYRQNALLQERLIENEKEKFAVLSDLLKDQKKITEEVLSLVNNLRK